MKSKRKQTPAAVDESAESEITIQPDGRIYAFGITKPLAAVLATIPTSDERMTDMLQRIRGLDGLICMCEPLANKENE